MTLHDEMESLADLHASGALAPDERREAESHAAGCPSCAATLRDASDFRAWIAGTISLDAPPSDLEDRVIARLRGSSALKSKRWRFLPGKRLLKVAGSGVAAAGLILLGGRFAPDSGSPPLLAQLTQSAEAYQRDYEVNPIDDPSGQIGLGYSSIELPRSRGDKESSRMLGMNRFWEENGYTGKVRAISPRESTSTPLALEGEALRNQVEVLARIESGGSEAGLAGKSSEKGKDEKVAKLSNDGVTPEADMQVSVRQLELNKAQVREVYRRRVEKITLEDPAGAGPKGTAALPADEPPGQLASGTPASTDPNFFFPEASPGRTQDSRKVIQTADVDLEVDSYDATATRLQEIAQAEKGFVASTRIQKLPNGKIRATVTVRVPPVGFPAVLAKLKDLGTVRNQNVGSQDVTKSYVDLETRRDAKQVLLDRLKLLLKDAKGTVKELLEVEVQMGRTIEEIESIKGELKFYDNQIGLSTLTLNLSEKDLGLPFEYVQTLQSNLGLTARDPDAVYARSQKEITDAGGRVVDSKMNRESDGSATATIRARVDADRFPAIREALKKLGRVTQDTVNQQRTAHGGHEGAPKPDAPLRKEEAVIDLSIATPPLVVTRRAALLVENISVTESYPAARKTVEEAGGKITRGSLTGRDQAAQASLTAEIDAEKFTALVESLKSAGKLKDSRIRLDLPAATPDGLPALLRERAEIELTLISPPPLVDDEHGIGKTIRDTFAGSWKGVLWSIEKLFVGISLAGPWLALALLGWLGWRRFRRKKPSAA